MDKDTAKVLTIFLNAVIDLFNVWLVQESQNFFL